MDADEDNVGSAEGGAVGVDGRTRSLREMSSVSGTKVIKKYEFQLQATGTRFSLI